MPLRDHFRPPLDLSRSWQEFHGAWPTLIVMALNRHLPPRYVAGPRVQIGTSFEIDVAAMADGRTGSIGAGSGGIAKTDFPEQDEFEVRIYEEMRRERRLVAAVEIVSPANKDRPEHRRMFVAKCADLLRQHVSVSIVDVVTTRQANLYGDLLDLIGEADPALSPVSPGIYATSCRWLRDGDSPRLETWLHPLSIGRELPTLPLWLAGELAVPLELESSYEETCRVLRLPPLTSE